MKRQITAGKSVNLVIEEWDQDNTRPEDYVLQIDHTGWRYVNRKLPLWLADETALVENIKLYPVGDPCD